MVDEKRTERITRVKAEFQKLLEFHARSFLEIDDKAKYWLTITLPSFVALMGYLLKEGSTMPLELMIAACALASCLFVSTIFFSNVLVSRRVESGILVPESREFSDVGWYLENAEQWEELSKDQTAEMLRSIKNYEVQNGLKAAQLRRGEISLLRGAPTSICLAASAAFLHTAACPSGLATTAGVSSGGATTLTAAGAGIAISALIIAALILANHFATRS